MSLSDKRRALIHEGQTGGEITYDCSYCAEAHSTYGEWQIGGKGSFCTPECVLAQGLYLTWVNNEQKARLHEENVAAQAGRKVYPAPAPCYLIRYDKIKGLHRSYWLPLCRGKLPASHAAVAAKESQKTK